MKNFVVKDSTDYGRDGVKWPFNVKLPVKIPTGKELIRMSQYCFSLATLSFKGNDEQQY